VNEIFPLELKKMKKVERENLLTLTRPSSSNIDGLLNFLFTFHSKWNIQEEKFLFMSIVKGKSINLIKKLERHGVDDDDDDNKGSGDSG